VDKSGDDSPDSTETLGQDTQSQQDGRQVAAQIRNHLAELKKSNPTLEKQIREAYFRGEEARRLGPIPEIRSKLELIDIHGGAEGIASMAEEVEGARLLDEGFERGDPRTIDGIVRDFPDGFKKLVGPAIDRLETLDPARYEQEMTKQSTKFLSKYGVFDGLAQMREAITSGKMEDVQRLYNDLVGKVFGPMQATAQRLSAQPDTSKDDEYKEREERVAKSERDIFLKGVNAEAAPTITRSINKIIASQLGNRKLTADQNNKLRRDVHAEIGAIVNNPEKNPDYIKTWKMLVSKNDQQRLVPHITRMWESKALEAVKKVMRESGFSSNGAAPRQAPRQAQPQGVQAVNGRPAISDVDFSRTDKARFVTMREHGKAWLLNGKQVSW
jgi:hypothetical protein